MVIPLLARPFLFMRHGRTAANAADIVCGQTDLPLDAEGHAQAMRAATALAGTVIGSIWTSNLSRARDSAAIISAEFGVPVKVLPGLGERDWGAWEGQPRRTLDRAATPPGGESSEAFHMRILDSLARVTGPAPVLIVAHSGTARVLHAALTDASFRRLANGEVVSWRPGPTGWQCHKMVNPS